MSPPPRHPAGLLVTARLQQPPRRRRGLHSRAGQGGSTAATIARHPHWQALRQHRALQTAAPGLAAVAVFGVLAVATWFVVPGY